MQNNLQKNKLSYLILGLFFLYMFFLNSMMPWHRDDYEYSLIWETNVHLASLGDVFLSMWRHYFLHGGRMVAVFIQDLATLFPKTVFNLWNAFMHVMLIVLIYWHGTRKITSNFNPYLLSLTIALTWFGLPDWGVTTIWVAGSCVYQLTAVCIFAMLLPYHMHVIGKSFLPNNLCTAIGTLLFGLIAGWTNENTGGSLVLLIFLCCYYSYKNNTLKPWMLTGGVGSVIGFVMLIAAPGNFVRAGSGKKLIAHVLNLFGAGAELALGLMLAIGIFMLAWRILLAKYHGRTVTLTKSPLTYTRADIIRLGVVGFMLISKLGNSFFSHWLAKVICWQLLAPLGLLKDAHMVQQLTTTLSGVEDVTLYICIIVQLFKYIFIKLDLKKKTLKPWCKTTTFKEVLQPYKAGYFPLIMLAMALITHGAMIASPIYPGRAGFGVAIFIIIGAVSLTTLPEIDELLQQKAVKRFLRYTCMLALIPLPLLTAYQYYQIHTEDAPRMAYVQQMYAQKTKVIELTPLTKRNEVLRHVYFVDFPNGVTEYGFKRYFALDKIIMQKK